MYILITRSDSARKETPKARMGMACVSQLETSFFSDIP